MLIYAEQMARGRALPQPVSRDDVYQLGADVVVDSRTWRIKRAFVPEGSSAERASIEEIVQASTLL